MAKLYHQRLVPFLSPMLEDEPGKEMSTEHRAKVQERNFDKIMESVDMVAEYVKPEDRAIAIKLTAFISIDLLVCNT